ncbi:MAG: GAF domain-containing protein, partial [Candidatus Omnitrophica bacterium]|nr:GAF domain-containing protein [Candidatus Omnitrophota bacterium]
MSLYAIFPFISGIVFLIFGIFILSKNTKSKLNLYYFLTCLSAFIWIICYSFVYASQNEVSALLFARLGYIGVVFIPTFLYNFIITFLRLKRSKAIIYSTFLVSLFFLIANTTDYFLIGMYRYFWGFYPRAGFLYRFYILYFSAVFIRSSWILFQHLKNKNINPILRNQIRYVLLAFLVGMTSLVDYVQNYGLAIYPWGYISALGWIGLMAIAIFKFRLMDISLTITRTGVFVAVYTLVLGLPFVVAVIGRSWLFGILGDNWWIGPLALMAALATVGPFVYIYLEKRAEAILLREQRRYQETLRQAAIGMTRIRDLDKLLNLIVHIVTKTVRISHSAIYLFDKRSEQFLLEAGRNLKKHQTSSINGSSSLVIWLKNQKEPLIYEEIKRMSQDNHNVIFKELDAQMQLLDASVIVPSLLEDKLLGLLIMGDKRSGAIYTQEDLNVFSVLASQAALAIENALFIMEAKAMQEQISQAEKMATIGTMADGLSHQINNRLHALSMIAGDTLDTFKLTNTDTFSGEIKETFNQVSHALERIQANVIQGREVVGGLLKYSRKGQEGFAAVSLDEVIDGAIEMVKFKVKLGEIDIIRDYPSDLPKLKANLTQLEEVLFNLIDNAYDAMKERKDTLKEEGYRGKITITCQQSIDDNLII